MIKWFPDSWVPDPDKKFSPFDENLIDQIIAGVLESDPKIKFIKKRHDTNIPANVYNQRLVFVFKKGEADFYLEFLKISEYNKKNYNYLHDMVMDYCDSTGYDDNYLNPVLPDDWVGKKAKKLVGIRIQVRQNTILTEFAVGSQEDHLDTYKKLNDHAVKKIPEIIDFIIKNYIEIYFPK
jgi:hypothetical protein|tara:strand:- start:1480 stop:2019 length:540 start_codon:yes stop_codon:yes gene_type:complete